MAWLFPPRFPFPNDPMRRAEGLFFKACFEQLDDAWCVLYNLSWTGPRNGHNDDSDADFVLINAQSGIFTVEVKGGQRIWIQDGDWFTQPYGNFQPSKIKDPAKQASESKRVLFDFIRRNTDVQLNGSFGHMVVFPGHIQTNDMAPHLPRRIICDALDLSTLSTKLEDLTKYWNQKHQLSQDDVVTLVDALIPTFRLVGTDRVHIDEVERGLDKLTRTQLEIWSMLGRVDRLVVTGGAGTGKTLLAHNQAIQLSNRGYKVLFLCATEGLAQTQRVLFSQCAPTIRHNVCVVSEESFVKATASLIRKGNVLDQELEISCMMSAVHREIGRDDYDYEFDAVIVDEAQSVTATTFEIFSLLGASEAATYIFGDHFQDWNDDSVLAGIDVNSAHRLTVNCRSTEEIISYAAGYIGREEEARKSISVSGPSVTATFTDLSGLAQAVALTVETWVNDYGLAENEIVVLSDRQHMPILRDWDGPWGISLHDTFLIDWRTHWTTDIWFPPSWKMPRLLRTSIEELKKSLTSDEIEFLEFRDQLQIPIIEVCPISSFLGLESTAVIVVSSFSNPEGVANPARLASDLYVACSRARSLLGLVIVGPR